MQITSSGWNSVVNSSYRPLNTGVLIGWNKTVASGINFFTINTSIIGGIDIIRGDAGSTNPSFFDKYLYDDFTKQVKNWSVERDIGQFPFGMIMAQADVELDNSSRMFLPGVSSTIGSGILPGRPLKISLGMNQDNLGQFVGFTGQPEISIVERNVHLHAYDVMDYLNNYKFTALSGTTYSGSISNVTTSSAISYYLGKLGFNANQMSLEPSLQSPVYFVNVTNRKFGQILQDLVYAEQGLLFADENGKPTFWNRQHFNTTSGLGFRFNLNYSNTISINYSNTPIINDVTVNAKPRQISAIPVSVYSQSISPTLNGNMSTTIPINFTDINGDLYVDSVIQPVYSATPIGSSYYSIDTSVVANAQTYISITNAYSYGTSYYITFKNTNSLDIKLSDLNIFGKPAAVIDNISQNYVDQTSVDSNGRNPANNGETFVINNDYIQDSSSALSLAYGIVEQYGQPNRHYDVEIFSNPSLQIGDFGTLDPDGSGNKRSVWITAKTDKLNPDANLTQLLKLEERTIVNYFTVNVSTIGGEDRIAP